MGGSLASFQMQDFSRFFHHLLSKDPGCVVTVHTEIASPGSSLSLCPDVKSSLHNMTGRRASMLVSDFGSLILVTESPHPKSHGRSFW